MSRAGKGAVVDKGYDEQFEIERSRALDPELQVGKPYIHVDIHSLTHARI